nr:MAG TPA: hypothetical protein [Bacteriophage sp.]
MPSIEELLNEAESHMAAQPVNDVLEINPETREISIPDSEIILGVETDQKAERKYFHCPKIVGNNIDLSALELYVVFQNARNMEEGKDRYHVTDVKTTSDGYITFSWELSAKVTAYKGDVQFVVCAIKTDSSGVKQNVWNTTIAIGKCLIGLSSDMSASEEQSASDLYTQLISELNSTASAKLSEVTTQIQTVGNNQVSNVNSAGTTQVNNIQNKGTEVLASIPDTYTELDASVKQLNEQIRGKAPVITESTTIQSGSPATVTDSAEMPLQDMVIYGKSEQVVITGAQLLKPTAETETYNGVTFTNNGDGTYIVNGTAKATAFYRLGSDFTVPAGTYTISDGTTSNTQSHFSDDNLTGGYNYSEKRTVTYDSEHIFKPYIRINIGSVLNNVTFKPMLNLGSEALPYEPYTGGKPSPSPEFPQEIVSVGGSGNIGVEITGKNLSSIKSCRLSTNMVISDIVPWTKKDKVYFSCDTENVNKSEIYLLCRYYNKSKVRVGANGAVLLADGTRKEISFEGSGAGYYGGNVDLTTVEYINIEIGLSSASAVVSFIDNIMLCDEENQTYEPYKTPSTATIPLSNGLPGIPVTTGGNYTDANGKQYICDEIDFARGKYVQRVKEIVLDGSDDEVWGLYNDTGENYCYYNSIAVDIHMPIVKEYIMCSSFQFFDRIWLYADGTKSGYAMDVGSANNSVYFAYKFASLSEWRTWLASNPVTLQYVLATPIETDLTESQIQAYKSLTTFKPTSIISNDANAQMIVEYACDTKTWVTNKINTLIKEATTS